jgi:predicted nucleic acid-binding protein
MKIERGTKVQVDTNVLLEATDEGRKLHRHALSVFSNAAEAGVDLFVATQVIREYLVVATRRQQRPRHEDGVRSQQYRPIQAQGFPHRGDESSQRVVSKMGGAIRDLRQAPA